MHIQISNILQFYPSILTKKPARPTSAMPHKPEFELGSTLGESQKSSDLIPGFKVSARPKTAFSRKPVEFESKFLSKHQMINMLLRCEGCNEIDAECLSILVHNVEKIF
jgi:hypothetical protein